jgi:hypothetical protein
MEVEGHVRSAPAQRVEAREPRGHVPAGGREVEARARARIEEGELQRVLRVVRPLVEHELRIEAAHPAHARSPGQVISITDIEA